MSDLGEKLRKVRALIEGATSVAEAEAASAAWQRIVMRHNLDEAEAARVAGREPSAVNGRSVKVASRGAKEVVWKAQLLQTLAEFNLCRMYREESNSYADVLIVGSEENIETVLEIWERLCSIVPFLSQRAYDALKYQIRYQLLAARMTPSKDDYPQARTWRHGFHRGFPNGLHAKMQEERDKEKKQFAGTAALVLVNDQAIERWVAGKGKTSAGSASAMPQDADGYYEGYKAGKSWEEREKLQSGEALALAG
jgi:hypothetical protein